MPAERDGLAAHDLQRGRCYSLPGFIGAGYHVIRLVSIGPKMVRYRGWDGEEWSARIERHPRVLFDSWDGMWREATDPSADGGTE
jgi:hypothetical protein